MLAYVNGVILPETEAKISIGDRGWLYGDAIFETLRTHGGRLFKLDEHFRRLARSADLIGLALPFNRDKLGADIDKLLAAEPLSGDIMLRVTVSRGEGGEGLFPVGGLSPTVVIHLRELPKYPPSTFSAGWSVIVAKTRRNSVASIDPQIKSTNFLNNVLAKREAVMAGADDALMLNHEGFVAEATVSNFFIVENGRLETPVLDTGILPGITRDLVIELATRAGIVVREELIAADRLDWCSEAFLTMTSAGIVPVTVIDGRAVADRAPGAVTERLRKLYTDYVDDFAKGRISDS